MENKTPKPALPFNVEGKIVEGANTQTPDERRADMKRLSDEIDAWCKKPRLYKEQTEDWASQPHESLESQFEQAAELMVEINNHLDEIENETN